jgi:hypothetical protein
VSFPAAQLRQSRHVFFGRLEASLDQQDGAKISHWTSGGRVLKWLHTKVLDVSLGHLSLPVGNCAEILYNRVCAIAKIHWAVLFKDDW